MRRLLLPVVLAAVVVPACGSSSKPATPVTVPAGAVVNEVKNIAFNPHTMTVNTGQTVAWKFDDGVIVHNVTGSGWHSGDRSNGVYTHTFTSPGTYSYRCTIHAGMDGVVVVK